MTKRLTGTNPGAYTGVEAPTPPNSVQIRRPPTTQDYFTFNVGDIWIDITGYPQTLPKAENIWMLTAKANHVATWVNFGSARSASQFQTDDGNIAVPNAAGLINVNSAIDPNGPGSADNLYTSTPVPGGNTYHVSLNSSIHQPNTNASGTTGMYALGNSGSIVADRFLHDFGASSVFVGSLAGNLTSTAPAANNVGVGTNACQSITTALGLVGVGASALISCTSGNASVGVGNAALFALNTGDHNVAIGASAAQQLTSGTHCTAIGFGALNNTTPGAGPFTCSNVIAIGAGSAAAYTGSESDNVIISNLGVNGESNTIRIGTDGIGAGHQNRYFAAGVRGITTGNNDAIPVVIDSAGQLGTGTGTLNPFYSTGRFTVTLSFGGLSTGIVYRQQGGIYTRIGNTVIFGCNVNLSSKGTATGIAVLSGLPFAASVLSNDPFFNVAAGSTNLTFDAGYTVLYGAVSGTQIGLGEYGSGQPISDLADTNFSDTTFLSVWGQYWID